MPEIVSLNCVLVVVNYGSHQLIEKNLRRLPSDSDRLHVVIVDNFSTQSERTALRDLCERMGWELVESPGNLGFGGGVNLGVQRALDFTPQTIVLLNPDAVIDQPALEGLGTLVGEDPNRLVCPRIEDTTGSVFFAGALLDMKTGMTLGIGSPHRREGAEYRQWFTGACLAFAPELWERLGGFDDDYFLYWEDIDLSFRAEQAGAQLYYAPDILVVHDEGGTQQSGGSRAKSGLYYYYNIRNRMLFARKWLPRSARWRWIVGALPASWNIVLRGGRRQLLQSFTPWKSLARGVLDGWKDVRGARI